MISVIVCSNRPADLEQLRESVRTTIGLTYEVIALNSPEHNHSIFSAYNAGVKIARYDTLCFVHDDVQFETENWGRIVLEHLSEKNIGFIGLAGGPTAPAIPAPWSYDRKVVNILQSDSSRNNTHRIQLGTFNSKHFAPVVLLDGVFMACRKALFKSISFDENAFQGFHCYDLDISLQAHFAGYNNGVINNLIVTHFSKGNLDKSWIECQLRYWKKWRNKLPVSVTTENPEALHQTEKRYMERSFSRKLARFDYSNTDIRAIIREYNAVNPSMGYPEARFRIAYIYWQRLLVRLKKLFQR